MELIHLNDLVIAGHSNRKVRWNTLFSICFFFVNRFCKYRAHSRKGQGKKTYTKISKQIVGPTRDALNIFKWIIINKSFNRFVLIACNLNTQPTESISSSSSKLAAQRTTKTTALSLDWVLSCVSIQSIEKRRRKTHAIIQTFFIYTFFNWFIYYYFLCVQSIQEWTIHTYPLVAPRK